MKSRILKFLNYIIFRPVKVDYSSQTIYQTLIGVLRLYSLSGDESWKRRAESIFEILKSIQRIDGGFDIGYDFNFGRLHRKGESTAPELVGLLALVEYYKLFGGDEVKAAAHKAALWVKRHALNFGDGRWAIPYGPYSSKDVMVYNGTSFAAGSLGVYLSVFADDELELIYHGMNKYLLEVLSVSENIPGSFWYYSDQSRSDLSVIQRTKIDFYHQMQQVEMHAMAELSVVSPFQKSLILEAAKHVAFWQDKYEIIPYYNTPSPIHLWGFCSCASGFIYASKFDVNLKCDYENRAKIIIDWMMDYAWSGEYFYPIVEKNGRIVDKRYYVRSDAWVFNTLALAIKDQVVNDDFISICEKMYIRMEKVNFSGIENHASNLRIRFFNNLITNTGILKNKLWPK